MKQLAKRTLKNSQNFAERKKEYYQDLK